MLIPEVACLARILSFFCWRGRTIVDIRYPISSVGRGFCPHFSAYLVMVVFLCSMLALELLLLLMWLLLLAVSDSVGILRPSRSYLGGLGLVGFGIGLVRSMLVFCGCV